MKFIRIQSRSVANPTCTIRESPTNKKRRPHYININISLVVVTKEHRGNREYGTLRNYITSINVCEFAELIRRRTISQLFPLTNLASAVNRFAPSTKLSQIWDLSLSRLAVAALISHYELADLSASDRDRRDEKRRKLSGTRAARSSRLVWRTCETSWTS